MINWICPSCKKVIEGFSKKDLRWRRGMHELSHRHEEKTKGEVQEE